jgi:hypothetical protein
MRTKKRILKDEKFKGPILKDEKFKGPILKDEKFKGPILKGGNVLASGGFGCIFKPALKCKNSSNIPDSTITKLMLEKNAKYEYEQINTFKSILSKIPKYQDYFLLDDFTLCEPDELTNDDLDNFDEKCKALKKKKITSGNINQNLDKILALNMPYGGVDIGDYLDDNIDKTNMSKYFLNINTSLIKLLVNGIVPMNKLNVYHCDVKGSNVLIQDSDDIISTRLIDWGLSVYQDNIKSTNIPKKLSRRPFQFNTPFSVILFNKIFVEKYTTFIELHFKKGQINYYSIREFVINYIFIWNKIRGIGHLKTINLNIKKLTYNSLHTIQKEKVKNQLIEYEFTYYYIIEYISKILFKYTINGKLLLLDYFNNVFLKTIDIWGFIMIYINFLDEMYSFYGYNNLNKNQSLFVSKIKYIVVHFLFESPTESIVTNRLDELVAELQDLNVIIANFNKKGEKNNNNLFILSNKEIKEIGGSKIETRKNRRKRI